MKLYFLKAFWAGIAQSVYRLATGCTIPGSNPGGGQDFLHMSRPALGLTQPPGLLRGDKAAGASRSPHIPQLAQGLKREYLYTPRLGVFMSC
jgi:hypothetical protein